MSRIVGLYTISLRLSTRDGINPRYHFSHGLRPVHNGSATQVFCQQSLCDLGDDGSLEGGFFSCSFYKLDKIQGIRLAVHARY